MDVVTIVLLIITGLMAGFLGGMVGVGGGIVMVPMLVYALHLPQLTAQGISLSVLMIPVSSLAVFNYYKAGHLSKEHLLYTILIAVFFALGTYISSKIVVSIDPRIVKKGFAVFMIVVAFKMLFEK